MHKAQLMRMGGDQTALLRAKLLYEVADSALTLVRNELLSSEDKIRLSEKFYKLSQAAIENCIHLAEVSGSQQYLEEAFAFSEKSKSNVLAQSLAANQAKQFAGIPDSLIALEDQLKSDINFFNLKLAEQPDSIEKILYQNELFTAQQAYRNLITQLENKYPFYYQLKYDQTVPRVRAIQFALPENTALVSYFTGDSVLYSFVISKKDFAVYRSAIGNNFYEDQVGFRKSITNKLDDDYIMLANNLYQKLFPFNIDKNIQSLIIIPDGTLSKLPFEALLSKKVNPRNEINFSQLPYLVNNYEMSYALSARLYYQEQSVTTTQQQSEGLLAYAPVFGELQSTESFINDIRNPLDNQGINRNITFDGKFITPLPATANEIQAIAAVFKQKGQKATTLLYQNANEKRLKQLDISQSRYLHIATHGFINEEQPDLSGLLFFPDTTAAEDHILYSGEVYNLNLNARLVVLSACETGLGKVTSGEGLLGLSRAFFYAGAENLVVSLWNVQDQATSDLMVAFYQEHLNNDSNNFGNPLQQAKLNMIRTDRFSHPYYWSAFVLIGQ
ncbi:MAG: CHAT domain-containing protein [Saprospiraceae bacterium]|nr:CHAT domain-containing protein [Saprospiraceae bacterium]